jgi:dTDP-4-amino-4,6-dideoxygalactose transaminase
VITDLRARPVFCEIDPDTLNVDIQDVLAKIGPRTKAILPVHYCGQPCDMDALLAAGRKKGVLIVEDAAHAFGSSYKGKMLGSFGDATCFSFDPIKNITCGEGGAVVLADDAVAEEIRRKRILGIDKETWHRYRNERSWFYEVTTQGYRYHMSNINAAIGLAQLDKFAVFAARKRAIVLSYNNRLQDLEGISLLKWNLAETVPFTYIVRLPDGRRDDLMAFLQERGVGSGVHYIANHIQPFFQDFAVPLPITDRVWREILTLPLYVDMTDDDVDLVIRSVRAFFGR